MGWQHVYCLLSERLKTPSVQQKHTLNTPTPGRLSASGRPLRAPPRRGAPRCWTHCSRWQRRGRRCHSWASPAAPRVTPARAAAGPLQRRRPPPSGGARRGRSAPAAAAGLSLTQAAARRRRTRVARAATPSRPSCAAGRRAHPRCSASAMSRWVGGGRRGRLALPRLSAAPWRGPALAACCLSSPASQHPPFCTHHPPQVVTALGVRSLLLEAAARDAPGGAREVRGPGFWCCVCA